MTVSAVGAASAPVSGFQKTAGKNAAKIVPASSLPGNINVHPIQVEIPDNNLFKLLRKGQPVKVIKDFLKLSL